MDAARQLGIVLIPLNSGLAWSMVAALKCDYRRVLIPLNSGLAWSSYKSITGTAFGLNPFEFRAGLEPGMATVNVILGLNPFEFRAGLERMV